MKEDVLIFLSFQHGWDSVMDTHYLSQSHPAEHPRNIQKSHSGRNPNELSLHIPHGHGLLLTFALLTPAYFKGPFIRKRRSPKHRAVASPPRCRSGATNSGARSGQAPCGSGGMVTMACAAAARYAPRGVSAPVRRAGAVNTWPGQVRKERDVQQAQVVQGMG